MIQRSILVLKSEWKCRNPTLLMKASSLTWSTVLVRLVVPCASGLQPKFSIQISLLLFRTCCNTLLFLIYILDRVKPLREEVEALEAQASTLKKQQGELEGTIETVEKSINQYKEEYASLISETQRIKTEMTTVKTRV